MNEFPCAFIVNPAARSGWVGDNWPKLMQTIGRYLPTTAVHFSQRPHHAQQLANQLAKSLVPLIISVGGDGTHSDVANGILESGVPIGSTSLGIIDVGTGGDFRRVLHSKTNVAGYCQTIATQPASLIDVIQVQYLNRGKEAKRFVLNMASCCLGASVVKQMSQGRGYTSFKLGYAIAALVAYIKFDPAALTLSVDGQQAQHFTPLMLAVANGSHAGGGMAFATQALVDDGLVNVTIIQDQALYPALRVMKTLFTGDVSGLPDVHSFTANRLDISTSNIDLEIDGDLAGNLPAKFSVLPKALSVIGVDPNCQSVKS